MIIDPPPRSSSAPRVLRAFAATSLVIGALFALGCGRPAPAPSAPVAAPALLDPCGATATAVEAYRTAVAERGRALVAAGWTVTDTLQLRCERASVIVARRADASDHGGAILEAFGDALAAPMRVEAGELALVSTDAPWDLRGDGGRAIVVRVAGCRVGCSSTASSRSGGEEVFELTAGAWHATSIRPHFPSSMHDDDGDGHPEFNTILARLHLADCEAPGCAPNDSLDVDVLGIEAFDGVKFSDDLRAFIPLYRGRLAWARDEAKRLRGLADKARMCPLEAIAAAASIDVYARILGTEETEAIAEADAAMAGFDTAPCEALRHTRPPMVWGGLRYAALGAKLPRLSRGSPTSQLGDH